MASPTVASARNDVRHQIRDGVPALDASPEPFNMVRLEELTDQLPAPAPATPTLEQFTLRYDDVPTGKWIPVQAVPGSLVAYLDNVWTPVTPTVDVDQNGTFVLPHPPVSRLLVTYAWQYFSDASVDNFVDRARQWLREFTDVTGVPDGLVPALVDYASMLALRALSRQATLARVRAGDEDVDWEALAKEYRAQADALEKTALQQRSDYFTQGPEAKDPTAVDVISLAIGPYTPLN